MHVFSHCYLTRFPDGQCREKRWVGQGDGCEGYDACLYSHVQEKPFGRGGVMVGDGSSWGGWGGFRPQSRPSFVARSAVWLALPGGQWGVEGGAEGGQSTWNPSGAPPPPRPTSIPPRLSSRRRSMCWRCDWPTLLRTAEPMSCSHLRRQTGRGVGGG